MFQRILVPLDGSEIAEQALPVAARIARGSGGSVLLLRVVDILPTLWPGHMDAFIEASSQEVDKYLTRLAEAPIFDGVTTETQVVFGSAASTILSITDTSHVDIIVICSRGHTGITRWLLGSVAEFVILHATVPVFLLREEDMAKRNPATPRPLCALVPLNTSDSTKVALIPAASLISALAAPAQGKLHLTHVVKRAKVGKEERQKNSVQKAEKFLRVTADRLPQALAQSQEASLRPAITWSVVVHENAAEGIISEAWHTESEQEDNLSDGCDVIVMKTKDINERGRWSFGSTTQRVLSRTQLPILIVPPSDKADTSNVSSGQMKRVSAPGQTHEQQSSSPEEESEKQEREFPLTRPGAVYPKDYIMAVIDDVAEAEDAVQSLLKAGVAAEDIRLFESQEVLEHAEHTEQNRSLLSRIADVFQAITSDEDAHVLIYVQEARRGHNILNVHAPTSEQVELVREVLVSHHARNIKHFGNWSITLLHY